MQTSARRRIIGAVLTIVMIAVGYLFLHRKREPEPVVVNVLRDGKSGFLTEHESKLLAFQAGRPRTLSGKIIIVQSIVPAGPRFEHILADPDGLREMNADVVILDSPEQKNASPIVRRESVQAINGCSKDANCPIFIPSWISGERKEAAEQILRALTSAM